MASTLLLLTGCQTVKNVPGAPISVPEGLNENDVELAILLAVSENPLPNDMTPGQKIADNVLAAVLGNRYESPANQRWYFEDRALGIVYVGYQRKRYYMRVAVSFDAHSVQTRIVESRNLDQSGDRIHKSALLWMQEIEGRIRRTLGMVARRNIGAAATSQGSVIGTGHDSRDPECVRECTASYSACIQDASSSNRLATNDVIRACRDAFDTCARTCPETEE